MNYNVFKSTIFVVLARSAYIPVSLVGGSGAEIAIIGGVSVVISLTVEVHPFADASEDGGRIVTMRRNPTRVPSRRTSYGTPAPSSHEDGSSFRGCIAPQASLCRRTAAASKERKSVRSSSPFP